MEIMINMKIIKRENSRSPTEAAIICRPYLSCNAVQTANGVMRNFLSQGSCVETSGKFEPGTILIVRMLRKKTGILGTCVANLKAGDNCIEFRGHLPQAFGTVPDLIAAVGNLA